MTSELAIEARAVVLADKLRHARYPVLYKSLGFRKDETSGHVLYLSTRATRAPRNEGEWAGWLAAAIGER